MIATLPTAPVAFLPALPPPAPTTEDRARAVAARVSADIRAARIERLNPARVKRATLRRISFDAWYKGLRAHANAHDVLTGARARWTATEIERGANGTYHPQVQSAARLLVSLGRGHLVYEGYDDVMTGGLAISYWSNPDDRNQVTTASERHVLHTLGERAAKRALKALAIGLDVLGEVAR